MEILLKRQLFQNNTKSPKQPCLANWFVSVRKPKQIKENKKRKTQIEHYVARTMLIDYDLTRTSDTNLYT